MTKFQTLTDANRALLATPALAGIAFIAMLPGTAQAQACQTGEVAGALECGAGANATTSSATAVGTSAEADGVFATAVGGNSEATGTSSTAIGQGAEATDTNTTAIGRASEASAAQASALGTQAVASGSQSTAIGAFADATADGASAFGNNSTASGQNSVALGFGSVATEQDTVSVGNTVGLQRRITNVANGVNANDVATFGQMQAADAALQTLITDNQSAIGLLDDRVTSLEAFAFNLEDSLSDINREIDGSTAVAVALSGGTFLPNKRFNITANVGGYDGAWAGAIQANALISDNVALNAGVATGFNRGGQTAVRGGVSFGW